MANLTRTLIMRISPAEIEKLDRLASNRRRRTGDNITRVQIVREAINLLTDVEDSPDLTEAPQPAPPRPAHTKPKPTTKPASAHTTAMLNPKAKWK